MKKRFNLLPTYHFEENTDGKIKNAATRVLRDCRIFGNCGKNLFNWDAIDKTQDWTYVVNGTTVSILDNGAVVTGNSGNKNIAPAYSNGWFAPGNGGDVTLAAGDTVTVSANIKAVTLSESFSDNNWCYMYLYGTTSITSNLQHQFPKDGTVQRVSQDFNITKSGSYHPVFTLNSNTLEITDIQIAVNNSDITYESYKTVGDLDAESGKYVLPVTISGKNLIPYPHFYLWHYPNGITFTDNGDGSITANGTSTGSAQCFWNFTPANFKLDKNATYIFSGCPRGGATDTYRLEFTVTKGDTTLLNKQDTGNGVVINGIPENYDRISVKPFIGRGTTVDNITFKPQLELGKTATEFEPYTAPKTTNLLLDAPLGVGESISCREKGLPVPELATLDPSITNCITFGSEVKPSGVTCEYYKY